MSLRTELEFTFPSSNTTPITKVKYEAVAIPSAINSKNLAIEGYELEFKLEVTKRVAAVSKSGMKAMMNGNPQFSLTYLLVCSRIRLGESLSFVKILFRLSV